MSTEHRELTISDNLIYSIFLKEKSKRGNPITFKGDKGQIVAFERGCPKKYSGVTKVPQNRYELCVVESGIGAFELISKLATNSITINYPIILTKDKKVVTVERYVLPFPTIRRIFPLSESSIDTLRVYTDSHVKDIFARKRKYKEIEQEETLKRTNEELKELVDIKYKDIFLKYFELKRKVNELEKSVTNIKENDFELSVLAKYAGY